MSEKETIKLEAEVLETLRKKVSDILTGDLSKLTQPESLLELSQTIQSCSLDLKDTQLEVKILHKNRILQEMSYGFCPCPPNDVCGPPPGTFIRY